MACLPGGGTLDVLLVCVGGGGLISGCAVAAKHLVSHIQVGVTIWVTPVTGLYTEIGRNFCVFGQ